MNTTRIMFLAVLAGSAILSGCGLAGACEERTDYKTVVETPRIIVPGELDPLQDIEQMNIPVASTPPDVDTSCLEKPPRFSNDAEIAEATEE